jgi:hypothetical protein
MRAVLGNSWLGRVKRWLFWWAVSVVWPWDEAVLSVDFALKKKDFDFDIDIGIELDSGH